MKLQFEANMEADPTVRLPNCVLAELERDKRLSVAERGLYLLAWGHDPASVSGLARIARMDRDTAAGSCRRLAEWSWMKMVQHPHGIRPAAVVPEPCQIIMAHDFEIEYEETQWGGEFLARTRTDWYLRRDEYICNARPAFLENPETKRRLEYDTYDRKNAFATEYDGSQHYRETSDYGEKDVGKQKAHDLIKKSLSDRNGITLVTFTYKDLRPGVLETRLDAAVPHLRRGYVDMSGPYPKVVNRLSNNYSSKVGKAEENAIARQLEMEATQYTSG